MPPRRCQAAGGLDDRRGVIVNQPTQLAIDLGLTQLPDWIAQNTIRTETGCLEWSGPFYATTGYGRLGLPGQNKRVQAHRHVWETLHRPLLPGEVVRHTCDNPPCVAPEHLIVGSQRDNVADMIERGRHRARYGNGTTCRKGHTYRDDDWQMGRKGTRVRMCHRCMADRTLKRKRSRLVDTEGHLAA